jgi:hypothetical protein
MHSTHTLAVPLLDIEEDVVTSLRTIAKGLRNHQLVFGQPQTQLLVITPVTIVAKEIKLACNIPKGY